VAGRRSQSRRPLARILANTSSHRGPGHAGACRKNHPTAARRACQRRRLKHLTGRMPCATWPARASTPSTPSSPPRTPRAIEHDHYAAGEGERVDRSFAHSRGTRAGTDAGAAFVAASANRRARPSRHWLSSRLGARYGDRAPSASARPFALDAGRQPLGHPAGRQRHPLTYANATSATRPPARRAPPDHQRRARRAETGRRPGERAREAARASSTRGPRRGADDPAPVERLRDPYRRERPDMRPAIGRSTTTWRVGDHDPTASVAPGEEPAGTRWPSAESSERVGRAFAESGH